MVVNTRHEKGRLLFEDALSGHLKLNLVKVSTLEDDASHHEAERNGSEKANETRDKERVVNDEGARPLTHVGTRVVARDSESRGRVNVRDVKSGASHEGSKDRSSVATEGSSNRDEQSGGRTLGEEEGGHSEERTSEEPRILTEHFGSLGLNFGDVRHDDRGGKPHDTKNHDEGFITTSEDGGVLDLRERNLTAPNHDQASHEHRDNDDVTGTERMTDLRLEEKHENDEDHGEKEDDHRGLSTSRKRLFLIFSGRHLDETLSHAFLEDRILSEFNTLEGGNQGSNSRAEESGRHDDHKSLAKGNAHRFNNNPHSGRSSGNRGSRNSDLGSDHSTGQRLGRTNAVLLSNFLDNVKNGHGGVASTGENGQHERDERSKHVDVLRIAAKQVTGNTNEVIHTTSDVHHGASEDHGHDDEDHVDRDKTRLHAETEDGNSHTETAGHTDANAAELSSINNAREEQCEMYPYHNGNSFGHKIRLSLKRV